MHRTLHQLRAGELTGAKRLDLSAGLTEFPREILDLADTLEVLNLSGNALSALPPDFARLQKLRILFCSDNQFTRLPEVLGQCPRLSMIGFKANQIAEVPAVALGPSLRWLILTGNQISELPSSIGQCRQLQKCMLAGNRLSSLPMAMAACTQLELLRISANQFAALPSFLTSLPRLSWLAYAGNPFCLEQETQALTAHASEQVDWTHLQLQQKLGEGASGLIYQASYWPQTEHGVCHIEPGTHAEAVAVKVFKGAMTSDGTPDSEIAACLAAGQHAQLIPVHGTVANHPDGLHGMVMALIDPCFHNLAGPPSWDSCTRDVYASNQRFSLKTIISMACQMAAVTAHLHAQGIMHGDLYAHNTLKTHAGECLLGDFGAASFLPVDKQATEALQRIEVRAYGCLLEELLTHCEPDEQQHEAFHALKQLMTHCLQPELMGRPLMVDVAAVINHIQPTLP
ncbi:protein kinase [Ampullimonas aquatilis]|uniref:protein kinase n=1 Tax=Ampullimonas aquatilis TaxID=1341549 RepID=UPI003C74CE5A